ncbi:GH16 beta-1,3-glucan recognition protein [Crepidotus variabilis]|uniref:GH16 beta-1,3-glucan recognition protein n=1 Tax=Crepidotus variabilis TaxID=179855 RepID=A0A9P6EKB5_9AGAR|nr:GH16 beta-1,3-glucan recognition protein [Crepidotus variabilis]
MPAFPSNHSGNIKLDPPKPKFAIADGNLSSDGEGEGSRFAQHSRNTSNNTSFLDSPPQTPRSITFNARPNAISLNDQTFYTGRPTGLGTPPIDSGMNTPGTGQISTSNSYTNLSRSSSLYFSSSRPGTADRTRSREPFASPRMRSMTIYSSVQPSTIKVERERPKSTMLTSSTNISKPWMTARDPYQRVSYFLTYSFLLVGIALGVVRIWFGWHDVHILPGNMCMVMDENFDSDAGLFGENGKFFREVDMSGFGNGAFDMTTASENNSYVKDGHLYITPTFTSDVIGNDALIDGHVYNITGCTYNITEGISYTSSIPHSNASAIGLDHDFDVAAYTKACSAVSNITAGRIVNPIQSARLSTRKTASIRFGRVEVRAKIPTGDWLWPAIWMLPVNNTYGPWPISGTCLPLPSEPDANSLLYSGEIDIMEARGNGPEYPKQGTDYVRGSLNWGPLMWLNAVSKTYGWWTLRRGSYDQGFHTYALEWDKDFIRMYVDTRLHHMLDLRMKKSFFEKGDFPAVVQNGTDAVILENPWVNATKMAPFDQSFYLILNVAVGGTNGWFPDGNGDKPWLDGSATAMGDFWKAKDKWMPTWSNAESRSMIIDHVKMWQQC